MKPLYVDGAKAAVGLDGPALRITQPGSADRWFPLRRLSSVVSSTRVDWETSALLACAQQGVTISFLDADGVLIARCIGRAEFSDTFQERLARFLLRDDWQVQYGQWLAALESIAVRSVLRRSGLSFATSPQPRALRQLFQQGAASMNALAAYERIGREVHSLLLALLTQRLTDHRIDLTHFSGAGIDLAGDLADVLFWDFQLARLRWLEHRLANDDTVEPPARLQIVRFFEARRQRTETLLLSLFRRLHRWLIELD